jgi:HSP20 family molecular chaperone IbpA
MSGLREFAESATNAVLEQFGRGLSRVQERRPLPYDLLESDEAYLVVFDAPGVSRSDLQVRFLDGAVQVRVDRFRDFYEGFEMRIPGRGLSLDGEAPLPAAAEVDPSGASATLADDGTLHVRVPKAEHATDVTVEDEPAEPEEPDAADEGDGDEVDVADEAETADDEDPDADEGDDAAGADDEDADADDDRD